MQAEVESYREAFLEALLKGDERAAEATVRDAIDAGLDEASISELVITPALKIVGEMWESGWIGEAHEHLATQISLRVLALQREAFRRAAERSREEVLLAAVEGERHVVGLEMAANLLRHAGFTVWYLGPDVPIQSLAQIVARRRPHVVGLTVTMPDLGSLLELAIDEIGRGAPGTAVLVGGAGVPPRLRDRPGLTVATKLADVVDEVDALIERPSLN